jgi:hypothetical protein
MRRIADVNTAEKRKVLFPWWESNPGFQACSLSFIQTELFVMQSYNSEPCDSYVAVL